MTVEAGTPGPRPSSEPPAVLLAQLAGRLPFFGPFDPTDVVLVALAAKRARKRGLFRFLTLFENVTFLHAFNIVSKPGKWFAQYAAVRYNGVRLAFGRP